MQTHNDSIDTTHTPPPLTFYNTFKGTVSWDRFQRFWQKFRELNLTMGRGWFLNFWWVSEKLKNQPRPIVRLSSLEFCQNLWNLSHATVPLKLFHLYTIWDGLSQKRPSHANVPALYTPYLVRFWERMNTLENTCQFIYCAKNLCVL